MTPISVKRSVKLYRNEGPCGFYKARKTRGAARAETAMANTIGDNYSNSDNVKKLLQSLYTTEADLIPDSENKT
ncbi:hypothetical protein MNBD_GAMMA16-2113, partial [hydrothermal vent metagenome]